MIQIRKAEERGHADHGWLNSYHTFSFADYHDPNHMRFRQLRVINEDWVQPGQGFATHSHRDMEIITYILDGSLEHKDSMGTSSVILPGEVQRMSAGTGVTHSEFNASRTEIVHLLQIWIIPKQLGQPPSYEQKHFPAKERQGTWRLIGSHDGRGGSVTIHQDVDLYAALLKAGETLKYDVPATRHAWVQIARGHLTLNGKEVKEGDGIAVEGKESLSFTDARNAEILLFDLA